MVFFNAKVLKLLLKFSRYYFKSSVIILAPLLGSLLPLILQNQEAKCAWVVIIMAFYWVFEVIPLALTALIPVFMFPALGIMASSEITVTYMKDVIMLLLSSLLFAIFIELSNLHKRIAFRIILLIGTSPRRIIFGFMLTTMFLSMWISNLSSTAMMIPIAQAIIDELGQQNGEDAVKRGSLFRNQRTAEIPLDRIAVVSLNNVGHGQPGEKAQQSEECASVDEDQIRQNDQKLRTIMMLAICYSANIGGIGSPVGSTPNLILNGYITNSLNLRGISFATWLLVNAPMMMLCTFTGFVWLAIINMKGIKIVQGNTENVKRTLRTSYKSLGPMSFQEKLVSIMFVVLVSLWFFRDPGFMPGWDVSSTVLVVLLVYVIPIILQSPPDILKALRNNEVVKLRQYSPTWKQISSTMPWGTCLVLGGGFALSEGVKQSGLSTVISDSMKFLVNMPAWLILLSASVISMLLTELVSNTAIANMLIPVFGELSISLKIDPLYILLPITLCCSFAFMLPAGTPPNILAYEAGQMSVSTMVIIAIEATARRAILSFQVRHGLVMNIVCVLIVNVSANTLFKFALGLDTDAGNNTSGWEWSNPRCFCFDFINMLLQPENDCCRASASCLP